VLKDAPASAALILLLALGVSERIAQFRLHTHAIIRAKINYGRFQALLRRTAAVEPASKSLASQFAFIITKRLASILLPIGFGLGDFISAAKAAFVEAAAEQIKKRGDRPSAARIAVVTGMSRAEVAKIRVDHEVVARPFAEQRTERVMHGWFADSLYVDSTGDPKILPMTGPGSFDELVRKYSGDIPRRAVLDELIAGGMAEITQFGTVKALRRHYLLTSGRPIIDLSGLAADADIFLCSATNSLESDDSAIRRVSVQFPDGIPLSVRRTVTLRTERFLEALADYLHANAVSAQPEKPTSERTGQVFHVMLTHCQADNRD
jgi:hypothetical protein